MSLSRPRRGERGVRRLKRGRDRLVEAGFRTQGLKRGVHRPEVRPLGVGFLPPRRKSLAAAEALLPGLLRALLGVVPCGIAASQATARGIGEAGRGGGTQA